MDAWWTLAGGVMLASLLMVGGGSLLAADQLRIGRWRRRIGVGPGRDPRRA
ncbi:MAG: hypothetical protein IPO99_12300 [Nitrospira sp.]|nr:hypothetical protein [Nitrospira sp.]